VIVEALGLRGIQARLRHARLDRERNPGGQPTTRGRHCDHVRHQPLRREILDNLAAGGALPRDHERIVIGRHQRGMALGCDLARDDLAVVPGAVIQHDLGAQSRGALALRTRRIRGHDDHRRHAEKARRRRDTLGVVARRECHHPAGAFCHRDRRHFVVRAAKLKRASALKSLRLEKYPRAGERVQHRRGHQRGAQSNARQP
jgi:hypothetical protein